MKRVILILSIFLLFFRLGETTLNNWDEAWLAAVARDGNWNGQVWFYEPPLTTWILSTSMKLMGESELALRLPFALFGLGIVLLTYRMAGVAASLVLLSDIEFLFRARQISTDIPLTFFLLLTVYAWLRGWIKTGWIAWGLAFLTKRATPLLLLPMIFFLPKRKLFAGLWIFLIIVLPWHGYMYWRFGGEFIQKYILGYTIGKITAVNPVTGTDPVMYFLALKHAFKIWSLVLPLAVIWVVRRWKEWKLILVIIMTFFVALTLAPIKASWYLLPIHPLVAIVIGSFLAKFVTRLPVFALVCVIVAFQLVYWRNDYIVPETTRHQAEMARLAGALTQVNEKIYLDDDYLPVAVFYSRRRVVPLRFNRLPLMRESLLIEDNVYLLTNQTNLSELSGFLMSYDLVAEQGELLLLRVLSQKESE